jgi:glycosyltransferase involved in cell wall biosynthesis
VSRLPRLTIGLPVYNGEAYLTESLESLLGQTFEDFELLISDNASTDGTAEICHQYLKQDPRIRYVRQPQNIGLAPNRNFVVSQARSEFFKEAAHDDLYARDLLQRCVNALDERPDFILAHAWEALIDTAGAVIKAEDYPVASDSLRAADRFRSMLFDGWGDDGGGVIRTQVLNRVAPLGSHHFADRTFVTELGLHGPFYQVPDWLYFRRERPEVQATSMRVRCAYHDPRRANRLLHPAARLYGEYVWAYAAAIRRAPMSGAEKHECYSYLALWIGSRTAPFARRVIRRQPPALGNPASAAQPEISLDLVVAGRAKAAHD